MRKVKFIIEATVPDHYSDGDVFDSIQQTSALGLCPIAALELSPLTPSDVNRILMDMPSDDDRLAAMIGVCECGNVKKEGKCWSCYESRW